MNKHANEPTYKKLMDVIRYLIKNVKTIRTLRNIDEARFILMLANIQLAQLQYCNPIRSQRLNEFNQAMIELIKGKWYAAQAMDTRSRSDWNQASQSLRKAQKMGKELESFLRAGVSTPLLYRKGGLVSNGTEINFAEGVPLVPEITLLSFCRVLTLIWVTNTPNK